MTHDTLCQCGAMTAEECGNRPIRYCAIGDERLADIKKTKHEALMDLAGTGWDDGQQPEQSGEVFRPNHYKRLTTDPVTFIGANALPFDIGNIIKYVCRFDAKNGRNDILKARRYCDIVLERLDREARIAAGEDPNDVWKSIL